ncbi:MAG: hypothetical protein II391_00655 [Kiritimatiellae bacterium]|jgi:hypothetical protein|nr:hypothetical protein [Kiritimatiellia bacterium]
MNTQEQETNLDETSRRLAIAEMQVERSKVVMESLAGFCHALGQPATVLLSSIELLKMDGVDEETKKQVVDMCHEAVLEIKSLLAEMKTQREYVAEAYLAGKAEAGNMISLPEWRDKAPPKASWDRK